jgi:hypothetical protein
MAQASTRRAPARKPVTSNIENQASGEDLKMAQEAPTMVLTKNFGHVHGRDHLFFAAGEEFFPGEDDETIAFLIRNGAELEAKE